MVGCLVALTMQGFFICWVSNSACPGKEFANTDHQGRLAGCQLAFSIWFFARNMHDLFVIIFLLHRLARAYFQSAPGFSPAKGALRSEEHTSELQSLTNLVCRLLL